MPTHGTPVSEGVIVPGSAHPGLASEIGRLLGAELVPVSLERFPDGELSVRLLQPVRGRTAIIVQPTAPPVDANLVELLALADACRRAAAGRIIAVVPYLGYARGDRRHGRSEPIMASLTAQLLQVSGVAHLMAVDLHAPQIEGFFHIPVDDLSPFSVLLKAMHPALSNDLVIVSPDLGRLGLATRYADELRTRTAVVQKRRLSGREAQPLQVVGDVRDRACLIVDDMITTGGTIAGCIRALLDAGARPEMFVAVTHGLFVTGAEDALRHPALRTVWVTDTIPQPKRAANWMVISVAPLIASALYGLADRPDSLDRRPALARAGVSDSRSDRPRRRPG
jgi:ribose-phosphate pyrophosphokinase